MTSVGNAEWPVTQYRCKVMCEHGMSIEINEISVGFSGSMEICTWSSATADPPPKSDDAKRTCDLELRLRCYDEIHCKVSTSYLLMAVRGFRAYLLATEDECYLPLHENTLDSASSNLAKPR